MEPKPKGGTFSMVRVTDEAGNEFICPISALRHPNTLSEEEKEHCVSVGTEKAENR